MPGTTGRKIHLQPIKLSWDNSVMLFPAVLRVLIAEQIILQLEKAQNFKENRFYKQSASTGETGFSVLFWENIKKKTQTNKKVVIFYDSELHRVTSYGKQNLQTICLFYNITCKVLPCSYEVTSLCDCNNILLIKCVFRTGTNKSSS